MKIFRYLVIFLALLTVSCNYVRKISEDPIPTFTAVKGIKYSEVHRRFHNGLSFHESGFQLEPEWEVYFSADDSIKIYSPERKQYMPYRIFHSHKALFHFARDWFRVKHVSKDSLVLQVMELESRVVKEELSNVYMTLYSHDFINNVLKTTAEKLREPSREDSLFVKYRAIQANSDPDSLFAARNPVVLKSKSKLLEVVKTNSLADPYLGYISRSEEYLYPEYKIKIDKAYQDFQYSFQVIVDHNGKMVFKNFLVVVMPEFLETKTRVAKGIIDVYLKNLLEVIPGNTLGYPHSSVINLHVKGVKK
ncbi:hypothetical protein [Daejeonella lutea]|uniref:Lipoprotein n=1 Tax=Daejeonella lutea TaxID=572036 RepID=A0A1T5A3U3_9SPHI|nr:hypothetical protein [Daejeonella lutea]SKB29417.1 hypothetical protein SAMN05661099_0263 [Daejeonella lutea]